MKLLVPSLLCGLAAALPTNNNKTAEYEFVIIGSGPGGGTLAANLARAGHSVFLLEAGDDQGDTLLQRLPSFADIVSEEPSMSWSFFVNHYQNETQARRDSKYTYRLSNGTLWYGLDPPEDAEPLGILYPRGATLGGSAQLNAMNFALPPESDWNYIAELTGDKSWSSDNMRRLFVDLENCTYAPEGAPGHGFDGFIASNRNNISYITERPGVVEVLTHAFRLTEDIEVENAEEIGTLMQRDINGIGPDRYAPGLYQLPLHIDGLRQRTGSWRYLHETLIAKTEDGSPKYPLTLSTQSLATRVLFKDGKDGKPRAYGVEYLKGEGLYSADKRFNESDSGRFMNVTAFREVIVAGGAFNTPQILKLSGVGPREELESHDIDVVVDLPAVGKYLQDNYEGGVTVEASIPWENNPFARCDFSLGPNDTCLQEWNQSHTGPYGEGAAPLGLLYKSSVSETDESDLFLFGAAGVVFRGYFPGYSTYQAPPTSWFWSVVKMQTGNQAGTITLRSADPREAPEINFNFFAEKGDRDLQAIQEAVEHTMQIFNATGELYAPYTVIEPPPGVDVRQGIMDEAFSHHATSTCRMGPAGDKDYCVDSNFKVNGVDGLRVVDASIFPRTPGGFPVAPTFVISQKAFEVILKSIKN
ncbi:GMC-OxRdtase-N domain-containing protein [Fusarium keratoplasticum]|uniref:GMC-OxRdtase-N domain-containing protein n=1 Tax=Fusarium keratoplasticum TaxID=1328300 RepID=A0ACC0R288_9HYPO|nr:GMC-OxRdtase-N domain-containing protein [Fusarium keratoplasticum]KAI8671869.1 GMC-OxRdtase-N domain-containing protein [Fusarium keratoplasticum]KAI8679085.1 GMC-OxRdtase-N domain-containing protein [Fusarium keratoplasticum]